MPGIQSALKPCIRLPADEDVLQRVVERVAQVQRAGHVRRRDDDRERALGISLALGIGLAVEIAALFPERVPPLLRGGVVVLLGKFVGG